MDIRLILLSSNFTDKLSQGEVKQLGQGSNSLSIDANYYLHNSHFQKYQWQAYTDRRKSRYKVYYIKMQK